MPPLRWFEEVLFCSFKMLLFQSTLARLTFGVRKAAVLFFVCVCVCAHVCAHARVCVHPRPSFGLNPRRWPEGALCGWTTQWWPPTPTPRPHHHPLTLSSLLPFSLSLSSVQQHKFKTKERGLWGEKVYFTPTLKQTITKNTSIKRRWYKNIYIDR